MLILFFAFFFIQVLVQYGEEQKVIVIDYTFLFTVKRTFETASTEILVFQKYDNEDKINNYEDLF